MKALTYELYLLEPLLATRLGGGDPNSAVGFDYIPGSMIRGLMVSRYTQQNTTDVADATDDNFRRLFLDGRVRFLNAYPQAYEQRTLPVPLSWHREKDEGKTASICDFAIEIWNGGQQWQRVKQPFCHLWGSEDGGYKVELKKPERHINIHTSREDRQKVIKGESTVFRYEALAPEQTFCGVILAEQETDLELLKKWLPKGEVVSLGGSHLAGYGQARIQKVVIQDDWCEYTPLGEDTDAIVVTLLSDAIIRDPRTGAYISTLEPIIGCAHKEAFVKMQVVGGFNRKWTLPLPQIPAIQAGSVFVYPAQDGLLSRLQSLESSGIGDRRAEGFGRIAINWHRVAEITPAEKPIPTTPLPVTLQSDGSTDLAKRIVERILRQKLDRALVAAVNQLKIQNPPSNAQLSRMRVVARQALSQNNTDVIFQHMDSMKKAARDQFQRARIKSDRLDDWLRARAENVQG
ncbi:MAG: RAMP superfamily CRISPR-associated protein, partial [Anaerolineae bacterium]|nr:RAMP superfamily CRISPR-associated protein [Anaerolineae bacterium]